MLSNVTVNFSHRCTYIYIYTHICDDRNNIKSGQAPELETDKTQVELFPKVHLSEWDTGLTAGMACCKMLAALRMVDMTGMLWYLRPVVTSGGVQVKITLHQRIRDGTCLHLRI